MPTDRERREMLELMLPDKIEIKPYTKIASFDDDDLPDGIMAVIRPVDKFGDPAKAVGFFYFQLWSYEKASGDRKGQLLAHWDVTIDTADQVKLYWTRAQMYEFQLAWTQGSEAIRPGQKYLFCATYRPPWDQTIEDQYEMEFTLPPEAMRQASTE